ncbi:MAG: hypothetical protein IJ456_05565 [Bacteroides sp.]|nr:hypothetical protein [Bacteroides sp.]
MKKHTLLTGLLAVVCGIGIPSCGESECPLTTVSVAHFDFLDSKTHAAVTITNGATVTGISVVDGEVLEDTIYNLAQSSMSLPLSYTDRTTYVMHYSETLRDTIEVTHKTIPFVSDIECGTMMHYRVEGLRYTTNALDSVVLINPEITNEERKNFNIYYRAAESE